MNILCNLPLECFEERRCFRQRIVTFGPPHRMWVDGVHYPFDVAFDPSEGSIEALLATLPAGFWPDVLLLYWPDQEPLPTGLERCPVPVVGIVSDYNLTLPFLAGLWPFFDVLLVDRPGVELFRRLSFADVRAFCQFSFKRHHRVYPDERRDVDIAFAGNLDPVVQRARAPWIERLRRLGGTGVRVEIATGIFGAAYGRFLSRARLGFNRSIRGEMNLRAFEVPACGALLLLEHDNREVRDFLVPGEEVVLYGESDFEEIVRRLLADASARERIARAGHARIREHRMSRRLDELERLLAQAGPGRPPSSAFDRALGRGIAMLCTWAAPAAALRSLREAGALAPCDPRPLHGLALGLLRTGDRAHAPAAVALLQRACALAPAYVPAALALSCLLPSAAHTTELERRLASVAHWIDLDGPALPLGYSARGIAIAGALRESVLANDPTAHLAAWG